MAKEKDTNPESEKHINVIPQSISAEMKKAYLDYAMSVIVARALPDVRDGMKPVHRRILFAMQQKGLNHSAKFRKSATVVGDVLGSYHPHGDSSVYDAMAKMAQDFSMRYPLVTPQGNFGSIDGDKPAAHRYTEAKMAKISSEMMRDIEKETVNFKDNFDSTKKEPIVLPAVIPNLLLNGTLGIAVGMATNIPPHNLGEVVGALVHMIDNDEVTTEDLLQHVKGPDFPLGGVIFNQTDITHAYTTGRGGVTCRGEAEIVETNKGGFQIIVTSIPYRVNRADLIIKIADLVRDKKIEGIRDMRDESTDAFDTRIVIDLKTGAFPQKVLNKVYKYTQLEEKFHFNMVALVHGVPQTLGLKTILEEFLAHREEVVRRRTEFDLRKAQAREHILLGLKKALDHIDEIIKLIRASKDAPEAHANLIKKFKFSELQATAILEMRLQKLAGLERKKIEDELAEVQKHIKSLQALLKSASMRMKVIREELEEIREKYSDDRRTKVVKGAVKNISVEDLVPDEDNVLVLTKGGYIKRTNPIEYKAQKRGGVGVVDMKAKEEDIVTTFLTTNTHSNLLFFSDKGKVYSLKMYELPEGKKATRGKSIMNFLQLESDEKITSVLPMRKDLKDDDKTSLMMVTREGVIKKSAASSFKDVRSNGLIAIGLKDDDRLVEARFVEPLDEVMLVTGGGQSIRFKTSDVREMGRTAAGVRGIKLSKDDMVVGVGVVREGQENPTLFVVSETGYGKKTAITEYKTQTRGGSGIKTVQLSTKVPNLVAAKIVTEEDEEMIAVSNKGQVIRLRLEEVSVLGRSTQGVRIMKLREGDKVASVVLL